MLEEKKGTQLREAVEKLKALSIQDAPRVFNWNGNLEDNIFLDTEALHVKGLVNVMNLPLESDDVVKLTYRSLCQKTEQSSSTNIGNVGSHISASQITLIPSKGGMTQQQLLQNVTYQTLENMLEIKLDYLEFNVEAKLEGLVICKAGQSYKSALSTQEEIGKFGTMFLQIPLKEDRPCGRIVICDGKAETSVKFENNRGYSAAAIAGGLSVDRQGSYEIQSATSEITVVMVCSLVWNDYLTFQSLLPVYCFPELLVLTNKIKAALMPWTANDSSDTSQLSDEEKNVAHLRMLCLPLSGPYKSQFEWSSLTLEDMIVVQSLKNVAFIDVHLASAEPYVRKNLGNNSQHLPLLPNANNKLGPWFCIKEGSHSKVHKRFSTQMTTSQHNKFEQNRPALETPAVNAAVAGYSIGTIIKFNPPSGTDTWITNSVETYVNNRHQCIVSMKEYAGKSFEELRFEDYSANRKRAPNPFDAPPTTIRISSAATATFGIPQTTPFGFSSTVSQNANVNANAFSGDIFNFPFSTDAYLISDIEPYEIRRFGEEVFVPVIVIRSRNSRSLSVGNSFQEELFPDDLLESLEERLGSYTAQGAKENSPMHRSLCRDLQQIIVSLKRDFTAPACKRCFFCRLLNFCVRLRAKNEASQLLKELLASCRNFKQWFSCVNNTYRPNALDPAASFADFISFTNGWGVWPDALEQLMWQLTSVESLHILSNIGLNFFRIGYIMGAQETFSCIIRALNVLESHEIGKSFHARLLLLAIHLDEIEPDCKVIDGVFYVMELHLEPHQLTELIKHLGRLNRKSSTYVLYMKELGNLVKKTFLSRLDPAQFFGIVRIYDSFGQQELVKSLWTTLCTQCVRPCHDSASDLPCLLCKLLRSSIPPEVAQTVANGLAEVTDSKEAVICSIQKPKIDRGEVNFAELMDFLQLLEGTVLSEDEIFENITGVVSNMSPEEQCRLSCYLFQKKRSAIMTWNTMRKIYGWLLEQIAVIDSDVLSKVENEALFQGFAWFAPVDLVKAVVKLTVHDTNERKKLSMILDTLKPGAMDSFAASSKTFSRETFNFLMLESIKALQRLDNRISDCVECFHLLATSERSFIDSTENCVSLQWPLLTESLVFLESVEIAKAIFDSEITNDGPCLKKFPNCWKMFTQLCNGLVSKWDVNVVRHHLTENHFVSLMQSFFWIGEEEAMEDFYCLIVDIPCFVNADVFGAIVRHNMTMELATSSHQGILTLIDLIDIKIQMLTQRLAHLCPGGYVVRGAYYKRKRSRNQPQPDRTPTTKVQPPRVGAKTQNEIDELQLLRRGILKRILSGQIKTVPNV